MFAKFRNWWKTFRLSLRMKMILALSSIAIVLMLSSIISILEYRRMSSYVSDLIADNIRNIHLTQRLVDAVDSYNLQLLAVVGDDNLSTLPDFDRAYFVDHCDSLRQAFGAGAAVSLADSVVYAYSAYMLASMELEEVLESDFINTRDWYFDRLQPLFGRMRGYLDRMSSTMYQELEDNSKNFDSGFFRSIVPGAVAVSVGILLVMLLMFFILVYYVKPIYGMLEAQIGRAHFESNDQLGELNTQITDLAEENRTLRRRIADLKERDRQKSGAE